MKVVELIGYNRSVMPFDGPGGTRATMMPSVCYLVTKVHWKALNGFVVGICF